MLGPRNPAGGEYRHPVFGLIRAGGVSDKKAYPLRISAPVLEAVQRWADDDLRSVNAQIEFLLRDALRRNGRMKQAQKPDAPVDDDPD